MITAEVGGTMIIINKPRTITEATRKLLDDDSEGEDPFAFLDEQDEDELKQNELMVAHVRMQAVLPGWSSMM